MIKNAEYVEGVETVESVMEKDGYIKIESVFLIVFIVSQQKNRSRMRTIFLIYIPVDICC